MGGNNMWRVVAAITLLLFGQHTLASDHGPSGQRNVFTRDMRDFSVADQGRFWGTIQTFEQPKMEPTS